jgi:hypothetical protein
MKFAAVLFGLLGLLQALNVKLIRLMCNEDPLCACLRRGYKGAVCDATNLSLLIDVLKKHKLERSYVFGWNDHKLIPMVLFDNGTLVPKHEHNVVAKHVICVLECTCFDSCEPEKPSVPCRQPKAPSSCELPKPTFCFEPSRPASPCRSERICRISGEEHESCESPGEECYVFAQRSKECHKSKHRKGGCPAKTVEIKTKAKTYIIDTDAYIRRGDVVVTVCSEENDVKKQTYVMPRPGRHCKRLTSNEIPEVLRNPKKLLRLKERLEADLCAQVCLYISDRSSRLYALVDGCELFEIVSSKRKHHKRRVSLKRVGRRHTHKLVKQGLYGVELLINASD